MPLPHRQDGLAPSDPASQRRRWLGRALGTVSWAALAGCASPWPPVPTGSGSSSARQRLRESAEAHGGAAWAALRDVNLAVAGLGSPAPGEADRGAGLVQVRWLPAAGVMALQSTDAAHPAGRQSHWRRWGDNPAQGAWRGSTPLTEPTALATAAWQCELLRLWWLGPAAALGSVGALNWAEPETLHGRRCDHLHLSRLLDQGGAAAGPLSLFIDRERGWLRRLRVPMGGGGPAWGGVAELDLYDHRRLHGVLWPLRCQLKRPPSPWGPTPRIWQLTGLDVNRGYDADDLAAADWSGVAAPPARPTPD